MANKKISELATTTTSIGAYLPIVVGGVTKKIMGGPAGGLDADTVSSSGIGAVAKDIGSDAGALNAWRGNGKFVCLNGSVTDSPFPGASFWFEQSEQGANYGYQEARKLTGTTSCLIKFRQRISSTTWSVWISIWTGDSTDGAEPAPKVQVGSSSSVGYGDVVDVASGATYTFPAGGSWYFEVVTYGATLGGAHRGIEAGGAGPYTASANLRMRIYRQEA